MAKKKPNLFFGEVDATLASESHPAGVFIRGFVDGVGSAAVVTTETGVTRRKYTGRGLTGNLGAVGRWTYGGPRRPSADEGRLSSRRYALDRDVISAMCFHLL